jgi:(p)ppGpp synthase/HD superfamily hydrolase
MTRLNDDPRSCCAVRAVWLVWTLVSLIDYHAPMQVTAGQLPLWQRAAAIAAHAHDGQIRKDGRTPYISHPMRVALTIVCVFGERDEHAITAALLHDVIEDTKVDYDDLEAAFGREVADIVAALTKDMRLPEHVREPAYDEQLAAGPWQARLIKLADVYDNFTDAVTDEQRRKSAKKADRAMKLAEGDGRLQPATEMLRRLVYGE